MDYKLHRHVFKMSRKSPSLIFLLIALFNACSNVQALSSWLIIGKLQALSSSNGRHICEQMPLLPKQLQYCERDPNTLITVGMGASEGLIECQRQFKNSRWNCTAPGPEGLHSFGKIVLRGTRETAFAHAITSAGVAQEMTRACMKNVFSDCSCDAKKTGLAASGLFNWTGCSPDLRYGITFAENFLDTSEREQHDARALMNLHNNRAGRRSVSRIIVRKCMCHGSTVTCSIKTCWDELGDFKKVGDYLKKKYDGAFRVTLRQGGPKLYLKPVEVSHQPPSNKDLVYLESSPNYCERNLALGALGTSGRECNRTSKGVGGCDLLCCGRGYDTILVNRSRQCNCRFHYCCEIRCDTCYQRVAYICKPESDPQLDENRIQAITTAMSLPSSSRVSVTPTKTKARGRKGKGRKGKGKGKKSKKRRKPKLKKSSARSKRQILNLNRPVDETADADTRAVILNSLRQAWSQNENGENSLTEEEINIIIKRFQKARLRTIKQLAKSKKRQTWSMFKLWERIRNWLPV